MILRALELHNYGIYKGTHRLQFKNRGEVIGILARYADAKHRSNRSGKTTLVESILYNLTGESRAEKEVELIHYGEDVMHVYAIYEDDDGNTYKIKRGRDIKGNGLLEINWIDKSREAQKEINELFGISAKDLVMTNYFKQADIHGFMDSGHASKAEVLMRYLANEHWKEKEKRAKEDRDRVKGDLRDTETEKKLLESSLEIDEVLKEQLKSAKKDIKTLTEARDEQSEQLKVAIAKKEKKKAQFKNATNRILEIKNILAVEGSNKDKRINLKEKRDEQEKALAKIKKKYKEKPDSSVIEANNAKLVLEREQLAHKLKSAKKSGNGVCPIINESCDRIKFTEKDLVKMETRLKQLDSVIKEHESEIDKIQEELSEYNGIEILEERISSIGKQLGLIPKKDTADLESELSELVAGQADNLSDKEDKLIETLEEAIDTLELDIKKANKKIGETEHRIEEARKALEKINEVSKKAELFREELEELNYVCMMFGKNGIPADEIDNAFQEIEDDINFILREMESGLSVIFSPDKEINAWELACSCGFIYPKGYKKGDCEECGATRRKQKRDEISLKIIENGKEANFSNDSGGGKTIISYAVRIALSLLKRRQNKSKLDMLFLDEVDGPLDPYFVNQIISSITRILTKKLGFKQIFLISHREQIKEMVPEIIQVTRTDESSSVRFI